MNDIYPIIAAHDHSANHKDEILKSKKCGCFYCRKIFDPSSIIEWIDEDENDEGQTALCPSCGIDSVIGDKSGFNITEDFLSAMHRQWFSAV